MSEPKFTPGPWRKSFTTVDCGRGRYINQIWWKQKDLAEAEANARLIAAAPEMLNLLETFVEITETNDVVPIEFFEHASRVKKILRKARGGEA